MRRLQPLDPEVDDRPAVRLCDVPAEAALAARTDVELGGVGEPVGDVLGLGDHRPDDVDRGIDVDLTLYAVGGHAPSSLVDLQLMVAHAITPSATDGCASRSDGGWS